jgi:hypothetical protein
MSIFCASSTFIFSLSLFIYGVTTHDTASILALNKGCYRTCRRRCSDWILHRLLVNNWANHWVGILLCLNFKTVHTDIGFLSGATHYRHCFPLFPDEMLWSAQVPILARQLDCLFPTYSYYLPRFAFSLL